MRDRVSRLENKIEAYFSEINTQDKLENQAEVRHTADDIRKMILELNERREEFKSYQKELLDTEERQKSLTDPDSRLMVSHGKLAICYNIQSAVDSKNKMVVDFEVTSNVQDKNLLGIMAEKAKEVLEVEHLSVVADAGYDSASDIAYCLDNNITPYVCESEMDICVENENQVNEIPRSYEKGRCIYLPKRNLALCPMGQILYPSSYRKKPRTALFYNTKVCVRCEQKCTSGRYKAFEMSMKKRDFNK